MAIKLNLDRVMFERKMSLTELADRMGVDRGYVSGLELGQRNPTVVTLWHISKALSVKLQSFFHEEKTRHRNPSRPKASQNS